MTGPVAIAFDQSTRALGFAIADQRTGKIESAGAQRFTTGARAADRSPLVVAFACRMLDDYRHRGGAVALERTWSGKNPATTDALAELRGRMMQAGAERGFDVRVVHPAEWRASVGVKSAGRWGREDRDGFKRQALAIARLEFPILDESDDTAEAVLLAIHLRGVIEGERLERRLLGGAA